MVEISSQPSGPVGHSQGASPSSPRPQVGQKSSPPSRIAMLRIIRPL